MNFLSDFEIGFEVKNAERVKKALKRFFEVNDFIVKYQVHPLGFFYLYIGRVSSTIYYRLHYWDKTLIQSDDLQIHDHSFAFTSFVLSGKIQNIIYSPTVKQTPLPKAYLYRVTLGNSTSNLSLINTVPPFIEIKSEIIAENEFYEIGNSDFHKSVNLNEKTITVLRIYKPREKEAQVYSDKKILMSPTFERRYLKSFEANRLTEEIYSKLK